ncbi:MAG: DUF222 domain-containing protein, partial [Ancrocorticia sp.]|uniref:HNH endonuclease signature motif containing protein n=1 Tax=Ancrocorticia sp. TaxID=2593684 RepID=UPI003F932451
MDKILRGITLLSTGANDLPVASLNLAESVDLIGNLKTLGLTLDGLTMAATGHVTALQAARRKAQEDAVSPDSPKVPGSSSGVGPLPGPDRTMYDLIANSGKSSRKQAGAEISLANLATESFPGFVASMRRGEISADYLSVLKQVARTPDLLTKAETDEARLLTLARELSVDEFRKSIRAWLFQHAPRTAEREVTRQERQEKFSVFAAEEGGYRITGWLTGLNGTALNMALRHQIGVPAKTDRRHHGQRCAEALMDIIQNTGNNTGNHVGHTVASDHAGGTTASTPHSDTATGPSTGFGSGAPVSRGVRHQIVVHVPLSTLVRTEEAIETGCTAIPARDSGQNSVSSDIHRVAQGGNLNTNVAGNASFHHTDSGQATGEDLFSSLDHQQGTGLFTTSSESTETTGTSHHGSPSLGGLRPETGEFGPQTGGLRPHGAGSPGGVGESCPHDDSSPETTKTGRKNARDRVGETFDVGQPPDWARPEASSGGLRPHRSESGSDRGIGVEQAPGTGGGVESCHVSPSSAGCPTTGRGLGRQGACLDGRTNVERELGAVLAEIRAGIDVNMLDGYSPARLSDGTPLAPTQLAELLCDSDIARVVLTAHGEPIDTSRSQRLFSGRQARAVAARDRSCRYPGCSRGIEVSQIHHAQQWEKGGP